jgi:hypothetical protein
MIDYILRLLLPASIALEALKRPIEAPKTVNEGQGSLNTVQGLKSQERSSENLTESSLAPLVAVNRL